VHWVPLIVWLAALVVALVILGFGAYELVWKTKRLRRELARLQASTAQLATMQHTLASAQERVAAAARPVSAPTSR
jgi:type II secretory pathway component PulM